MKKRFLCIALLLAIALCGCAKGGAGTKQPEEPRGTAGPSGDVPSAPEVPEPSEPVKTAVTAPTAEEVYAARERALAGMTEDQIRSLTEFVKRANLWLEDKYLYKNFFQNLKDPDNIEWNYFHQTGEIQIGWAYDGSIDKEAVCEAENLTENEFYEKYATGVCRDNPYDADGFAAKISSLKENVSDEALDADLQSVIDETLLAKDTHNVEHVFSLYRALHDLDYFLLRYGPGDVGPYVKDASTVCKYYGTLSMYGGAQGE